MNLIRHNAKKNSQRNDNNSFWSVFVSLPFLFMQMFTVRSFGTEDRETSYPIMPQPTVYDYILFRGSDIKDIRVVNNVAIPNDPAIMQMHLPPQQNFPPQNFPQLQQPGGAPPMNQFGPFGQMQGPMGSNMGQQQQQTQSPIQSQHQGNNNNGNLAPGSGSGQKNKKSSELSKSKDVSSEKSTTTTSSSAKPTAIRKQSNKSQGVHRSLSLFQSLSLSRLSLVYFFVISMNSNLSVFPPLALKRSPETCSACQRQHASSKLLLPSRTIRSIISCTSDSYYLFICFHFLVKLWVSIASSLTENLLSSPFRLALWNTAKFITQVSNIRHGHSDESESRKPVGWQQGQASSEPEEQQSTKQ